MSDISIQKFGDWQSNEMFLLRDDLLPVACGGNKVRIALKLLEDAMSRNVNTIVGYGNSRSNLCRVLAMLCAKENLRCVIVSPSDEDGIRYETSNSRIVKECGATIIPFDKHMAVSDILHAVFDKIVADGDRYYYIFGDEYGHGNEVVLRSAYENVAWNILRWEQENVVFDRVVCAVGTGSTYAGLLEGFRKVNRDVKVTGFTIARNLECCIDAVGRFTDYECDISDVALLGGYGHTSPEELSFLQHVMRKGAVVFDPVYAGKALWGCSKLIDFRLIKNERILFVHTGSLPLALDALNCAHCFV